MDRSAKKAVAHQGKDDITQGGVDDTPIEGVEPCLVEPRKWGQWFALAGNLQMEAY
jgi:hypothetical protein